MRFFADRFPNLSPFYKEYWENGKYYAENDEIVLKSDSFADHYLGLKGFQGEDNVELLIRAKFEYSIHKQGLMMVRGSSFIDPASGRRVTTGYTLSVYHQRGSQRLRLDDNVPDGLEVYSDKTLRAGVWTWFRFRAEGTWLRAKAWEDGASEPISWDIAVSQSRWEYNSKGANGLSMASGGTVRVNVVSASTLPLPPAVASDFNPQMSPYTLTNDFATGAPMGGFPAGGAYINPKPRVYSLVGNKSTERLTIKSPTLTGSGPKYNLKGRRGWVHLVFKKQPTLTYIPPKPGELRPVYALRPSRATEKINISSPTLIAYTAALIQPERVNLRVDISSPSVIFIPKPEILELIPSPVSMRLIITRTNNLLDPSVYNIEYKQYKPDYVGIKAYEGETLNIDRYRPDTIETGKIDSIELKTNRYKQIVIK